jgi:hypothetical protein
MRTNQLSILRLILLLAAGPAACTDSESPEQSLPDGHVDMPETLSDARDPLYCDAIYVPLVTFTFTDAATGKSYCGPATISYEAVESDVSGQAFCECRDDVMARPGLGPCHVNPPEGETSLIMVSVPGYEVFETEVTLPYECHPQIQVDVILVPRSGPLPECTGMATFDLGGGPDGCDRAWIHGEQMCPQEKWCDLVVACMAYCDFPAGTCACAEPPDSHCCPITILEPEDGQEFSQEDDFNRLLDGIQIQVTVDTDCWYMAGGVLFVHLCDLPVSDQDPWFEPNPDHDISSTVDLASLSGCGSICAEIRFGETILAEDRIEVCVP